jgi:serine/threonine protein kinase
VALPPRPRAATLGNPAHANRTRDLPPGSVVLGRYTIQKVLGRGGMAAVYLAKHQQTDRLVALKLLDPEFSRDPAYVERFRREAKAAGRIRSDHVVAIYDLDAEVGGSLVLVMEYLEGISMQSAVKTGRMPIQRAISFGRQMLEGLAAAHEAGVIHRDLKPANLFIEKSSTGSEKVKLLDFGISKLADASQQELTRDGQTLGTVAYMAPEQIRGKASATDPRVDLYSAGVSLFIMLTGKRPIDGEDTVQLLAAVLEHPPMTLSQAVGLPFPSALEAVIARALEKDPNRRFQTAIEMRDALVEAGKVIGYESTGPLTLPSASGDPSGVVVRNPTATQAAPSVRPPTLGGPTSGTSGGHAPITLPAPMPSVGAPSSDPFGMLPPSMAPPPMVDLGLPQMPVVAPPPAPVQPARKSSTPVMILLGAVGIVALGAAGVVVSRTLDSPARERSTSGVVEQAPPATTPPPAITPPPVPAQPPNPQPPTQTAQAEGVAAPPVAAQPTEAVAPAAQAPAVAPAAQAPAVAPAAQAPAAQAPAVAPAAQAPAAQAPAVAPAVQAPAETAQRQAVRVTAPSTTQGPSTTTTAPSPPRARTRTPTVTGTQSNPFDPAPAPATTAPRPTQAPAGPRRQPAQRRPSGGTATDVPF